MWHIVPSLEEMRPHFATKAEAKRVRKMLLEANRIHQSKIDETARFQAAVQQDILKSFGVRPPCEFRRGDFFANSFTRAGGTAVRRRLRRESARRNKTEQTTAPFAYFGV